VHQWQDQSEPTLTHDLANVMPALSSLVVYDTPPNLMPMRRSARVRALAH